MLQRISQRLSVLIGIALLALFVGGANTFWQLRSADQVIASLNDNIVPSLQGISHARESALESRALAGQHIMSPEEAQMQAVEAQAAQAHADLLKALEDYRKQAASAEDLALLQADITAAQAYMAVHAEVLRLSRANDDQAARHLMLEKLLPASDVLLASLLKHDQFNDKLADQAVVISDARMQAASVVTIVLLLVTTLVLVYVAWTTYRTVVGTTRRASMEMQRVARELDFSRDLDCSGRDEISDMVRAFNGLMARLRDGFSHIRDQTLQLAQTSHDLAEASGQVVAGSNRQNDAAARMAGNIEEVTVSISHVSTRADEANHYAAQSGEQAAAGRRAVDDMVQRISEISGMVDQASAELRRLEDEGRQIGAVVNVIKEVADQTNLLALNAAIEAARAGEQGRGFAVVADEVRKLAERTASSTVEIARMVGAVQQSSAAVSQQMAAAVEAVRVGVAEGEGTRRAIDQIAEASAQSCSLVGEIAAAMREQSSASNDIATQVERVAQMADENSHTAQRSTQLTEELHRMADAMKTVVEQYRL